MASGMQAQTRGNRKLESQTKAAESATAFSSFSTDHSSRDRTDTYADDRPARSSSFNKLSLSIDIPEDDADTPMNPDYRSP